LSGIRRAQDGDEKGDARVNHGEAARAGRVAMVCLGLFLAPACLVRRHVIPTGGNRQNLPLMNATKEELIARIHQISDPIDSFLIRADLSPSVVNPSKRVVTEYATIGAYILFRRPNDLRIIGQEPVMSTTILDMASTGNEFHVYLPTKNRFLVGQSDVPGTSKNVLENLRPSAFLNSLLIAPPDPETSVTLLEDDTDNTKAIYILLILDRQRGRLLPGRNVYFDRYSLQIIEQKAFDPLGAIISDTKYSNWKRYGNVEFPSGIDIRRPRENYEVQLTVLSVKINAAANVTPEKFVLRQPEGTKLEQLN